MNVMFDLFDLIFPVMFLADIWDDLIYIYKLE